MEKTFLNYIGTDGNVILKYVYQIQMQIFLANRKKAMFAVAKPELAKKL